MQGWSAPRAGMTKRPTGTANKWLQSNAHSNEAPSMGKSSLNGWTANTTSANDKETPSTSVPARSAVPTMA